MGGLTCTFVTEMRKYQVVAVGFTRCGLVRNRQWSWLNGWTPNAAPLSLYTLAKTLVKSTPAQLFLTIEHTDTVFKTSVRWKLQIRPKFLTYFPFTCLFVQSPSWRKEAPTNVQTLNCSLRRWQKQFLRQISVSTFFMPSHCSETHCFLFIRRHLFVDFSVTFSFFQMQVSTSACINIDRGVTDPEYWVNNLKNPFQL